eukprot:scaffold14093_cov51-Phaeocystis_antarctica.AAC.1
MAFTLCLRWIRGSGIQASHAQKRSVRPSPPVSDRPTTGRMAKGSYIGTARSPVMVGAGPRSCHRGAILAGGRTGDLGPGGSPKSPTNILLASQPWYKRCGGATAQSALGWYRPSVEVSETLDGRPSGVLV